MIKKFPYILLLLILFSSVIPAQAQIPLPEKICIGTKQHYWVDGLPGSTYTWKIDGTEQSSTSNQIDITWLRLGISKLEVQEHQANCVGIVQSGTVEVTDEVIPTFAAVGPYCSGTTIPALPTKSINGIIGTWSPALDNTSTTEYTFTPAARQCATTTHLTIEITDLVVPTFADIGPLCMNSAPPLLSLTSNNGIKGTWNPATINTATAGIAEYTFTPSTGQCASKASLNIEIVNLMVSIIQGPEIIITGGRTSLTALVSGGSGEYTYLWNDPLAQSTATATNLRAGFYVLIVTDAYGCKSKTSYEITEPKAFPVVAEIIEPINCPGGMATILVSASGGVGPYGGIGEQQAVAGTYQYPVTDLGSGNISQSNYIEVKDPEPMTAKVEFTDITCHGANDGKIVISEAKGGTGFYEYRVNEGNLMRLVFKPTVLSNLPAGDYTIELRDASFVEDCIVEIGHGTIKNPLPILLLATGTNGMCHGENGSISFELENVPDGNYNIGHDAGSFNNVTVSNNHAVVSALTGIYNNLKIIDKNGCSSPDGVNITLSEAAVLAAPVASVTIQPDCMIPTGTIAVTDPLPASGISYILKGTNPVVAEVRNRTGIFSPLTPGKYEVTITNEEGCMSPFLTLTVNPAIGAPPTPVASVTVQPDCVVATGTVEITAPLGNTYEYSLDGSTFQGSPVFANLPAGNYPVTVREAGTNCISVPRNLTVTAVLGAPPTPEAKVTVQPDCIVATGTIEVTAPLGSIYEYSLDGSTYQGSPIFANLFAGIYSVTVKETAASCVSISKVLTINPVPGAPVAPMAEVTVQPDCILGLGTIEVTAPLGAAYQYGVDAITFQSSPVFTHLMPGSYGVRVKDTTTGCISSPSSLVINPVPDVPAAPIANVTTQPDCILTRGTIEVTAPLGATYQYSVDGTSYQVSTLFPDLLPGTYPVTVKETATGCISVAINLKVNSGMTVPAAPVASVTVQPDCILSTGTIEITEPLGNGYEYSIDGLNFQGGPVFANLPADDYALVVRETSTGCISSSKTLKVTPALGAPPIPEASVTVIPNCRITTGTIEVSAPLGADYQYSIDGSTFQGSTVFAGLLPGSYHVTVKEKTTGCSSVSKPLKVTPVPEAPAAPFAVVKVQPDCIIASGTIEVSAPLGTIYEYSIDGSSYRSNPVFAGLLPGTYPVTVRVTITGCISLPKILKIVPAPGAPAAPVASVTQQPDCTLTTGTIKITAPLGSGYRYSIDAATYQDSPVFDALPSGNYPVTVRESAIGCVSAPLILTVNPALDTPVAPMARVTHQPDCNLPAGAIEVTAPLGAAYRYSMNGAPFQSSPLFAGLTPGSYGISVKEATSGCVSPPTNLKVNPVPDAPAAPVASVTTQPDCILTKGIIQVTSPLGPLYEYSLDGLTFQGSPSFAGLMPGSYGVKVKEKSNGCISAATFLTVTPALVTPAAPVVRVTQPDCILKTGMMKVTAPMPALGITYTLKGTNPIVLPIINSTGVFDKLIPGIYEITTTNASGCTSKAISITINPSPATADPLAVSETHINVDNDHTWGSIDLTVSGGTGHETYLYSWSNGAVTQDLTKLSPGTYVVQVSDQSICNNHTLTVQILNETNLAPIATDDEFTTSCSILKGDLLYTDNGHGIDHDPEGDSFSIEKTSMTLLHGALTIHPDGSFEYQSEKGYIGDVSFQYRIFDKKKNYSTPATVTIHLILDTDHDGIADADDLDADGDGILNMDEVLPGQDWRTTDTDGDGLPNYLDIDSDGDGIVDQFEAQSTADYIQPSGLDVNHNGVDDAYDPYQFAPEIYPIDTDGDGLPDFLDLDSDNDLVPDFIEGHDADFNGKPDHLAKGRDKEDDGLDDGYDTIVNDCNVMGNATGSNASMQDFDGDGLPDWRDDDDDNDKILTRYEDLNGDGDFSNDDIDFDGFPEYLDYGRECDLLIPDAFSPNRDNVHDYYQIYCINHYPNARIFIFDQLGNKIYEKSHYGNLDVWKTYEDAWWNGMPDRGPANSRNQMVDPGTYYYVLDLGNGEVRKSFVFVSY